MPARSRHPAATLRQAARSDVSAERVQLELPHCVQGSPWSILDTVCRLLLLLVVVCVWGEVSVRRGWRSCCGAG